jgi:ABC-type dipeptide/oligopeptide/nickel transport system ATPase component
MVPAIDAMPDGCRFFDRCPRKDDCRPDLLPQLLPLKDNPDHLVRCLLCE